MVLRLVCAIAASGLAALGSATAADLAEIRSRGVLRIAVSPLAPFVMKDEDGAYRGFEIDATAALARHLGVEPEYVETPFCSLGEAVLEDKADIVASGFSNIATRRTVPEFSLPYHDTEYVLTLSKAAAKRARTLRGVNRKDIIIGYQQGCVSGEIARSEFSGATLKAFSSFADILDALAAETVDGAVLFAPYDDAARKLRKRSFTVPHKYPLSRTIEAFAMAPDSDALKDEVNAWIIAKDLDGYWDELEDRWFDPDAPLSGGRPAETCPSLAPTG